jgi:NADPH:quinone reductase-like Zn-dependent oxidoreductase
VSVRPGVLAAALAAAFAAAIPQPAHARGAGRRPAHAARTKSTAHAAKKTAPRTKAVDQEGKVVLLPLRDDDDHSFTAQIERLLRAHGVDVATDVRGVDTAEQFRELATHLGIAAFVDGTLKEKEGNAISKVTVQVRSGYTGRRLTLVTFRETKLHLRAEMEDKLWAKVAPSIARACVDAAKPRKRDRDPMMIQAGIPLNAPDPAPPPPAKPKRAPAPSDSYDPWSATAEGEKSKY